MSSKASSPSAQAAAPNQAPTDRTTRAMKAKAQAGSSQQNNSNDTAAGNNKAAAAKPKEINPTSHLSIQHFPNGKIIVNSNGKPERQQHDIDTQVEHFLNRQQNKMFLWGTQVPSVTKESMPKDFEAMGYPSDTVKDLVKRPETLKVDGFMQRFPGGFGKHVAGSGASPPKAKKPPVRGKGKYEALVLFEDQGKFFTSSSSSFSYEHPTDITTEWILFDPLRGYPEVANEPPHAIARRETFEPGNARILVQHKKTKTIKSQATPAALQDRRVDYTGSGPKIEGWAPIASTKKAPSPPPPPPALSPEPAAAPAPAPVAAAPPPPPAAAPALGRGAIRKTRLPPASEAAKPSAAPAPPKAAPKKRKAAELSADPAPEQAPEQAPAAEAAAEEEPAAVESGVGGGEGGQKKKRRPGRPKITPARVENSSSE